MTSIHVTLALLALAAPPTKLDPGEPVAPTLPKALVDQALPWDAIVIDACKDRLGAAGLDGSHFRFSRNPHVAVKAARGVVNPIYCHVPQGAVLWSGPTGIRYHGFVHMSCAMTLAMVRFEEIAQAEARRVWERPEAEQPIRAISHYGTFNCRKLRYKDKVSEHSYGNALDIASFTINGVWGDVSVLRHWTPRWKGAEKASEFLRSLARRLREEEVFTNVLDPDWDVGHKNHFHLDMAPITYGEPSRALARVKALPATPPDGPTGPKGPRGPDGLKGPDGPKGPDVLKGPDGRPGARVEHDHDTVAEPAQ